MRQLRWIGLLLAGPLLLVLWLGPTGAGAQSADASPDEIAAALNTDGRYLEFDSSPEIDRAIDDANGRGIAFVWINGNGADLEPLVNDLADVLDDRSSRYGTVLAYDPAGALAASSVADNADTELALDASFEAFSQGDAVGGLDAFTSSLASDAATTGASGSGGGIRAGRILLVILVLGGGFFLFKRIRAGSKARKEAAAELEADRDEITQQLQDNADRVVSLGDRVITSGDTELITVYEEASAAYQEVSRSVATAETAAEVDALDDKIDHAEWQLLSIEARLDGEPVPPSPAELEATRKAEEEAAEAERRNAGPALGLNESVFAGGPQAQSGGFPTPPASSGGRRYPAPRGGGGGFGGILGGVLGSIVLGGGRHGGYGSRGGYGGYGGGYQSRRSDRRRTTSGSSSRRPRSSGGRSFGSRKRSSGGRRF